MIREDIIRFHDRESEYKKVLRDLKFDMPINTCSHTLNLLIDSYKTTEDINENLE